MECSDVGFEILALLAITTVHVAAFVVGARSTQRWLREHPRALRELARWGPGWVLEEGNLWAFRIMFGAFPLLMFAASVAGIYCFFHGPG